MDYFRWLEFIFCWRKKYGPAYVPQVVGEAADPSVPFEVRVVSILLMYFQARGMIGSCVDAYYGRGAYSRERPTVVKKADPKTGKGEIVRYTVNLRIDPSIFETAKELLESLERGKDDHVNQRKVALQRRNPSGSKDDDVEAGVVNAAADDNDVDGVVELGVDVDVDVDDDDDDDDDDIIGPDRHMVIRAAREATNKKPLWVEIGLEGLIEEGVPVTPEKGTRLFTEFFGEMDYHGDKGNNIGLTGGRKEYCNNFLNAATKRVNALMFRQSVMGNSQEVALDNYIVQQWWLKAMPSNICEKDMPDEVALDMADCVHTPHAYDNKKVYRSQTVFTDDLGSVEKCMEDQAPGMTSFPLACCPYCAVSYDDAKEFYSHMTKLPCCKDAKVPCACCCGANVHPDHFAAHVRDQCKSAVGQYFQMRNPAYLLRKNAASLVAKGCTKNIVAQVSRRRPKDKLCNGCGLAFRDLANHQRQSTTCPASSKYSSGCCSQKERSVELRQSVYHLEGMQRYCCE